MLNAAFLQQQNNSKCLILFTTRTNTAIQSDNEQIPALHSAQNNTDCAILCKEDNTIRYGCMVSGENGDKRRLYCGAVRAG